MNEALAVHKIGTSLERLPRSRVLEGSNMIVRETSMQIKYLAREGMQITKVAERCVNARCVELGVSRAVVWGDLLHLGHMLEKKGRESDRNYERSRK